MLVEIGLIVAGVGFLVRQAGIRSRFLKMHKRRISEENSQIAATWKTVNPTQRKLIVDREFQPPGFLSPKVRVRQVFRR